MLQPKDFRGTTSIDAAGRFFSYTDHTSPGTLPGVRLFVEGQPVGIILPGQTFEVEQDCRRWDLVPLDQACTGRVLIGYGRMHTGRVVGPVETEGAVSESIGGAEFYVNMSRIAAASLFGSVGLVAGTRPIAVRRMHVVGGSHRIMRGTGGPASAPLGTRAPMNKASGAASTAIMQVFDATTTSGPIPPVALTEFAVMLANPFEVITASPMVLAPNESLWAIAFTAAAASACTFEFTEL